MVHCYVPFLYAKYLHSSRFVSIKFHVGIHVYQVLLEVTCRTLHPVDLPRPVQLKLTELPFTERGPKRFAVNCSHLQCILTQHVIVQNVKHKFSAHKNKSDTWHIKIKGTSNIFSLHRVSPIKVYMYLNLLLLITGFYTPTCN